MELTIVIEHATVAAHSYYNPGKSPGKEPDLSPDVEQRETVEPWSDHTRRWGESAGGVAGKGTGAGVGTLGGMAVDSNPVTKIVDALTTADLPDAQGSRHEIETSESNPIKDHSLDHLIEALEVLQSRGAKHYTTLRVP